jgi:cytochrome c oxidase assembly protein subunit 15
MTAVATLVLICVGGLVTSHGVGLAVPDWPTTYGYNPFFFPFSKWVGGIFYEHSHRLVASAVGFFTVILALWIQGTDERRWLRRLGWLAVGAVILQGILGGLRVRWLWNELGIFHAALAQLFFVMVCVIALFCSRRWRNHKFPVYDAGGFRYFYALTTLMIFGQLILGATMRHQHAGLAIPDFPRAYGKAWPATDPDSLARYNAQRTEARALNPITRSGILLQMAHRATAGFIVAALAWVGWATRKRFGASSIPGRLSLGWLGLILVQAFLGAATIWTNKTADIATAHVAVGALSLALGSTLTVLSWRPARTGAGTERRQFRVPTLAGHNVPA